MLLRARAIENQVFVLAADQYGAAEPHYDSFGRSMIVDPWGVVLAQAPDARVLRRRRARPRAPAAVREALPSLANRRPAAYRWPEGAIA